jgi:hypothetical protein
MVELTSGDKAKISRLQRQLKHVPAKSKEARDLRDAIKKVKDRAKER